MALQDPLEIIYRDHAPVLFRFLIRLTGSETETKDTLQEIFIRLAQTPRLLDGISAPRSYLFRLAHHLVIDRHRRETTRRQYEIQAGKELRPVTNSEPSSEDDAWLRKTLAVSLDALPPEQKAVVLLKVWEDMTFAEIAHVLDISPNTAASRYRYALDKLHDQLRPLQRDLP
jgi:RNA polymerase sigma-70 factor (ECF subfamily)